MTTTPSSSKQTEQDRHTPSSSFLPTAIPAAWLLLLILLVAFFNRQANLTFALLWTPPLLATLLVTAIRRLRHLIIALPIALTPSLLVALDPTSNGYSFINNSLTNTAPNSSTEPPWFFFLLAASVITFLFNASKHQHRPPYHQPNATHPITINNKSLPLHDLINAASVHRFVSLWQWVLLAIWLLPTFSIFFEDRMIQQFNISFGPYATEARIAVSMLILLVWLVLALSSFLMPIQSLTYYPVLLNRQYLFKRPFLENRASIRKRLFFSTTIIGFCIIAIVIYWLSPS